MNIKTSRNLISSLRGAPFHWGIWDGRVHRLRTIKTLGTLRDPERQPVRTDEHIPGTGPPQRNGESVREELPAAQAGRHS